MDIGGPSMLSEISIFNIYFPPLFVYLGAAALVYRLVARVLRPWLDWAWHSDLARFAVSIIVLSVLVLTC